jgi:hypothetical protein
MRNGIPGQEGSRLHTSHSKVQMKLLTILLAKRVKHFLCSIEARYDHLSFAHSPVKSVTQPDGCPEAHGIDVSPWVHYREKLSEAFHVFPHIISGGCVPLRTFRWR